MRALLATLGLMAAAAAIAVLVSMLVEKRETQPGSTPEPKPPERFASPPPEEVGGRLRPYETAATLREDLRDALASPEQLEAVTWRVAHALAPRAEWTLTRLAPDEASPRVRALLVLAAGIHVPDSPALQRLLADRAPVVRSAAALATGYAPKGRARAGLAGVSVPLGRRPGPSMQSALHACLQRERDGEALGAIEAVLAAAGLSSRR